MYPYRSGVTQTEKGRLNEIREKLENETVCACGCGKTLKQLQAEWESTIWREVYQGKFEDKTVEPEVAMCPCGCGKTIEEAQAELNQKYAQWNIPNEEEYEPETCTCPEMNVEVYEQESPEMGLVFNILPSPIMEREVFVSLVNAVSQNMDALQDVKQLVYNQDGHTCTYDHLPNTIIEYLDQEMQTDLVGMYFFELSLEVESPDALYDLILDSQRCTCND